MTEIERLKAELAEARAEIERLRGDVERQIEAVAELQLAAFIAGRGSIRSKDGGRTVLSLNGPTWDDYRNMARAAIQGEPA